MISGFLSYGGYSLLALALLALVFTAFIWRNFGFLHFLLLVEAATLAVCLLLAAASLALQQKEGDVLVLFVVAIAAAETAVGIALYLRTLLTPPASRRKSSHS